MTGVAVSESPPRLTHPLIAVRHFDLQPYSHHLAIDHLEILDLFRPPWRLLVVVIVRWRESLANQSARRY